MSLVKFVLSAVMLAAIICQIQGFTTSEIWKHLNNELNFDRPINSGRILQSPRLVHPRPTLYNEDEHFNPRWVGPTTNTAVIPRSSIGEQNEDDDEFLFGGGKKFFYDDDLLLFKSRPALPVRMTLEEDVSRLPFLFDDDDYDEDELDKYFIGTGRHLFGDYGDDDEILGTSGKASLPAKIRRDDDLFIGSNVNYKGEKPVFNRYIFADDDIMIGRSAENGSGSRGRGGRGDSSSGRNGGRGYADDDIMIGRSAENGSGSRGRGGRGDSSSGRNGGRGYADDDFEGIW